MLHAATVYCLLSLSSECLLAFAFATRRTVDRTLSVVNIYALYILDQL